MATNPCPCGYYGDPAHECSCSPSMVSRYQKRISGPLLDRIDIHVEVPRVEYDKLTDDRLGEPSAAIRERVEAARAIQRERFTGTPLLCNADTGPAEVREFCQLDSAGKSLLRAAMMTALVIATGSTTSCPMDVASTTPKRNGPAKWATARMPNALRGDIAREEIMVATMLLASWKPFKKSNTKAMAMMMISKTGIGR